VLKKNIAILGLGEHQLESIRYLKKYYDIIGFDEDENCPGKKIIHSYFNIGLKKKNKILEICKKYKIEFAVTFCNEYFLQLTNDINKKIGLSNNSKLVSLISNKYLYKKKIVNFDNKLLPEYRNVSKISNLKNLFFPNVLKPKYGSGSKGVLYLKNSSELKKINFKNKIYSKGAILERYIPGTEYAIDGWVYNKKFVFCCTSKKKTTPKPNLLDQSLIINLKNEKIRKNGSLLVKNLIEIFKINNVPIHVEFKIYRNKPILIDFSIRGAGFGVYSYIMAKIIGQNTTKIQVNLMLKKKINFRKPKKNIFYLGFFSSKPGKIKNIRGFEKIKTKVKNCKIKFFKKIGEFSQGYKSGSDRIGQIIFYNNNLQTLKKKIGIVNRTIRIDV
jgi:hypothetical protein